MILFLDTETYSPTPLAHGLARYATTVEVMIATWAIDDGPVHTLDFTNNQSPEALLTAARAADRIVAHNAQFDRTVLGGTDWWLKDLNPAKWYCSMAMANRHGLPGGLDKLSTIFKLDVDTAKDKRGRELINLFCKPQKKGVRATRHTHPGEWREFLKYAGNDITSMRAVYRKCPKWNDTPYELALWQLDQEINLRGMAVDVPFAAAAVRATREAQQRLSDRTSELTGEVVDRTTQRDLLLAFLLVDYGVTLPDLKADTIQRRLDDPELPECVKELLRIRQSASKSSTAKYKRVLEQQVGGRLYFLLQYYAAYRTGRWGGRNFQPHNLPRRKNTQADIEAFIDVALAGCEDVIYG